jgi:hypothetical protein
MNADAGSRHGNGHYVHLVFSPARENWLPSHRHIHCMVTVGGLARITPAILTADSGESSASLNVRAVTSFG